MRRTLAGIGVALAVPAGSSLAPAQVEAEEVHPEWGSVSAPDQVLRKGCRNYRYHWNITNPPEGIWAIETFLIGPGGKRLAHDAWVGDYDPASGTGKFRLCKATTRYGKFTIKTKFSAQNGFEEYVEGWLPPSKFRLRRPKH